MLFETADVCDARASKVCGMYVEDLDLRPDDEHARVHGKGGTVLLDDRGYVALDPPARESASEHAGRGATARSTCVPEVEQRWKGEQR